MMASKAQFSQSPAVNLSAMLAFVHEVEVIAAKTVNMMTLPQLAQLHAVLAKFAVTMRTAVWSPAGKLGFMGHPAEGAA
jgi:hypothetical protein